MSRNAVQSRERLNRDKRCAAIVKAAGELFYERGYKGTSLNAILKRAGGSKRNFYTEFGGKEGLFKTLVSKSIERQVHEQDIDNGSGKDLRTALLGVARRIVASFANPELMGLYRIALLDGLNFPEVARAFFDAAPRKAEENIAQLLARAAERGEVATTDYAEAANCFVSMLHRKVFFELFFGIRSTLGEAEIESFVSSAVTLFLEGIGAAETAESPPP